MWRNWDPEILAKPAGCDTTRHLTVSSPRGDPSSSYIAAQSLEAKFRAAVFVEKGESSVEDDKLYCDNSALMYFGSRTTSPTMPRASKAANSNSPARRMSSQGERDDNVAKFQHSDHPVSERERQRAIRDSMHGMPVQSIMKAIINLTDRNQNNSDAVLSLRSGYDSSVEPSQRKKHQPDTLRPHTPYAQLFPAVRNNRRQASTTTPAAPKPFVFPGLVSSNNNNSNNNKKRKTAYFGPPFTRFQALSNDAQQSTHNYLRGDPATNWAVDLGLPLMDMFRDLRCCVLLLCEDENPGLRAVLRDPVAYARFRDGLNPNFLAPDGDFVRGVRELSPGLDARLRDPYQRWRIVLAFRTVDFPAVVEESESEGEGEDAVADGENWDEETIGVDSLGSGDLEMST